MAQADGSIIIDTQLNADGMKAGSKEIEAALKRSADALKKIRDSAANYNQEAIKFVEEYAENFRKTSKSNNEFKNSIEETKKELSELEEKGLYFGDEEYDNAFLKLQNLIQAVKDYKKELLSPIPNANPFDMNTIEGQLKHAKLNLQKLYDSGKGLGTPEYDGQLKKVSELTEAYKRYKAEVSKTDAQIQAEADKQSAAKAKEEAKFNSLSQKIEEQRAKVIQAAMEADRLKAIGDNAEVSRQDIVDLNTELAELKARQMDLRKAGLGSGFKEFDSNEMRISQIESQLRDYQKSLLKTNEAQKKAVASSNKFSKSLKNTGKSAKSAQFGIGKMLGTSLLFSFVFQGISAATNAIKKGFQNLAQYSGETNSTLSLLWSSLERLQNSLATAFAPILNTIAPILTQFIDMLSTAATYVSMFFAFLSGQSTYIKAIAVQKDYAASLKDTAGAANDAADAMNNYLSPLDDLNKYEDPNKNIGGGASAVDPSQMFETVELDSVPAFEKIKEILTQIFSPFKAAWEKEGKATIDSAKAALKSLGELAQSVGRSMLDVWNNGTGTIILSTMLQIAQHLFELIGNIAERLNFAWNTNSAGIQIIQNIANIFQTILDFINRIVLSTADWAASLNFYPLLQAIGNLLSSLQPIIEAIGNFLSNIYEAIILPIASYVIEYMLPGIIEVLSGFFAFLGDNQWIIEAVGAALIAAFSVKKFTPLATGIVGEIKKIIGVMTGSGGIITAIKGVVSAMGGPLSIAITAGIALLILLVSHWDEVKAAMSKFDEWLQGIFEKDWTETFGVLGEGLNIFFDGVQDIWNGVKDIFNGIITFIKGAFTGNLKQALDGIKQIFKGIIESLATIIITPFNGILGGINKLVSGVVSGINVVIRALNHLSFEIPSWVPAFGGKKFGFNLTPLTAPKIPYLAQGAVIPPNREFMAVLGDQKHGNNIETPESLLRDIIRQELNNGNGEEQRIIIQVDRKTLFEAVLKEKRLRQRQTGMDPLTT